MFTIGQIEFDRPLVLAPMENVSDRTFRSICKSFGADLMYTEFVNCEAIIRDVKKSLNKMHVLDGERPVGVQIYGSTESSMERAAAAAEEFAPDFIDINCGCWVRKIAMRGDGAGLLRDINKFENVVQSVMKGTRLPVTVKTRLGWDESTINIVEIARMLEQNGVKALTVHCRTREQAYKGEADWSWLEKIKSAVSMPLIGNGDVKTPEDASRMFDTGCDGVMIGRAAIYAPWIFRQVKHYLATGEHLPDPDLEERTRLCIRHLLAGVQYKGERRGVLEHRKYYAGYLRNARNISKLRMELMQYTEVAPIVERLEQFIEHLDEEDAVDAKLNETDAQS